MKAKLHHTWNCGVDLVDVLTPGVVPNQFSVDDWFGSKASKSFRDGKFKETQLVFKIEDGKFVVIPDTPGNKWLWSFT